VRQQVLDKRRCWRMILSEDTPAKRPSSTRTGSFLPITESFSRGMTHPRLSILHATLLGGGAGGGGKGGVCTTIRISIILNFILWPAVSADTLAH